MAARGRQQASSRARPRCCGCARYAARRRGKFPGRLHLARSGAPRAAPWGTLDLLVGNRARGARDNVLATFIVEAQLEHARRIERRAELDLVAIPPTAACFPDKGARGQPLARPQSRPCAKAPQRRCRSSRQAGSRKRDVARGRLLARTAPPMWGPRGTPQALSPRRCARGRKECFSSVSSIASTSPGAPPSTNTAFPLSRCATASGPNPMRSIVTISPMPLPVLPHFRYRCLRFTHDSV